MGDEAAWKTLTLGLLKMTLLDAEAEGLVEERVEHGIGGAAKLVVRLDILLEGLTAAVMVSSVHIMHRVGLRIASCRR